VNYFETNTHRMRYAQYRKLGMFLGSGVIEAGCKSVIGARLKTIRHALDNPRRNRYRRPTLPPRQQPLEPDLPTTKLPDRRRVTTDHRIPHQLPTNLSQPVVQRRSSGLIRV
jgi:hypothetical protein